MDLFGDKPGLPGLCTACFFSAALSTVSSGLNSLSAIAGEDIIKSIWPDISETKYTVATKILAVTFGVVALLTTVLASQLGAILQASLSIFGMVGGPLFGLFSLGVFFPCVNSYGAGFGTLIGLATSVWIGIGAMIYPPDSNPPSLSTAMCFVNASAIPDPFVTPIVDTTEPYPPIAWLYSISYCWYSGLSWLVCIVFGLLISFATGHNDPSKADVTLHRPIADSFLCCLPDAATDVCRCGVGQGHYPEEDEESIELKELDVYDEVDAEKHENNLA